jgi:hypothetical protein
LEEVAEIVDHAEQDRVFDEARRCKGLEEVILAQAERTALGCQPSAVLDVPVRDVEGRELANRGPETPAFACADCRHPFTRPDHDDDDGEDYCPNPDCGERLIPDENWLDAKELDSSRETALNLSRHGPSGFPDGSSVAEQRRPSVRTRESS